MNKIYLGLENNVLSKTYDPQKRASLRSLVHFFERNRNVSAEEIQLFVENWENIKARLQAKPPNFIVGLLSRVFGCCAPLFLTNKADYISKLDDHLQARLFEHYLNLWLQQDLSARGDKPEAATRIRGCQKSTSSSMSPSLRLNGLELNLSNHKSERLPESLGNLKFPESLAHLNFGVVRP